MNINDLKGKFQQFVDDGHKPNNKMVADLMGVKSEPIDMDRFKAAKDEFNSLWFD